jgi:type II secretory pathway pseudopilin PulG
MIRPARKQQGFTIIEILLAIGVLMVGSVGALGLFVIASDSHRRAVDSADAALAAEGLASDLESVCCRTNQRLLDDQDRQLVTVLDAGEPFKRTDQQCANYPQFYYDFRLERLDQLDQNGQVTRQTDDPTELLATLTLKHTKGTDSKHYTFQTIFLLRSF